MVTLRRTILLLVALQAGCTRAPIPSVTGTQGVLRIGKMTTSDILVHVYQKTPHGFEEIGFGQTADDGTFGLFAPNADRPLWLKSGDYSLTIESIGAPIDIPLRFRHPQTTPLNLHWTEEDRLPELQIPEVAISVTRR